MKIVFKMLIFLLMITFTLSAVACSKGKSPVETVINDSNDISQDIPISFGTESDHRSVLAIYNAIIDTDAKAFTVEPANRSGEYHFPLTQLYPNVLQITGYGWTPNFWADIKLTHPMPGSGIDAFDPRVIAILPANPGVSMNYPIFNVQANNSVILEPDGYTKLFDWINPSITGNANPFVAYFKDQPNRVWSSTGLTEETQRWQMDISGFGGPLQYLLVVDVSTNYPNPPQPVTDNAPEPVQINAIVGSGLTSNGGSADIIVTFLDWQGRMSIGDVLVEAPDIFNDIIGLSYSGPGPNPNEYVYTGTIVNSLHAPLGEYKYIVAAYDQVTSIYVYNEFSLYVNEGNLIWAKRAGGVGYDEGNAITTLSDNSTVVAGYFENTATFGLGETNETVLTSEGGWEIFNARYNPDGTLAWAKRAGGASNDIGCGIKTLSDNSTVMTGYFYGTATFGPGEPNEIVLTSAGISDIFIARYNPDGTLEWAKRAGGSDYDWGYAITTLSGNSTVVTGPFRGSATFGQDDPNETVLTSNGNWDIFNAQYNPDGTLAWAKRAGGTDSDWGYAITTLSDDSTVVTGSFSDAATFGTDEPNETVLWSAGYADIFIAKYNPDGTLAWAKSAGGSSGDWGEGITTLSGNSTVITGCFGYLNGGTATFGPNEPTETVLISAGYEDIFIARYNSDGTLAWAKRAGGPDHDRGHRITTLSDNSTVVTGYFKGTTSFGSGEINQTILASAGNFDIFVAKYNSDGSFAWAIHAGGSDADAGNGITTLSDNSTVVTGYFEGRAIFGPGEPTETALTSSGSCDIFIARFEP